MTIRLAPSAGIPVGIEVDTAHFSGNHAEYVSVLAAYDTTSDADERVKQEAYTGWIELLGKRKCEASRRHAWVLPFQAEADHTGHLSNEITHVKLQMWPDGGIARFRLYGHAVPTLPEDKTQEVELSASLNGGVAVNWSDQHFGKASNILLPGRGVDMGDGWETARSREPGHRDWVVVRLGARGRVKRCVVDTMHFRGNFPRSCEIMGYNTKRDGKADGGDVEVSTSEEGWSVLGRVEKCDKDTEHEVHIAAAAEMVCTHVKLIIEPDGGVKRLRVFGERI